jgi:plastocyanin
VSCPARPSWPALFALALILPVSAGGSRPAMTGEPGTATRHAAVGRLEGEVRLPARRATRTSERYQSSTGEARDIQDVPAVVYIAGSVPGSPSARASAPLDLTQQGEAFRPTLLVVPTGATVKFPNGDPLFHNVFSYSRPKRFDLGRYPRGESKNVVFDTPGYVKVLCEVHKWMRAGVLVVDNPYYAVVAESGRFRIDDVPAGRYRVVVETFDRRSQADVSIPDGGVATVTLTP